MRPSPPTGFGPVTLAALVAANMIGAGVFTTSGYALADLGSPVIVMATVLLSALVHGVRAKPGAHTQNFVVLSKLLVIGVFLALAVRAVVGSGAPGMHVSAPFSLASFAGSLVWISLSYSGFNAAVYVAGEARDPRTTVPRALILASDLRSLLSRISG